MKKAVFVAAPLLLLIFCFTQCIHTDNQNAEHLPYACLVDSTVTYVGMEQCVTCHNNIHQSFHQTGMGQSWDVATRGRSKAIFTKHTVVFDSASGYYYHPFWRNDSLFITEYRLNQKDTTYKRTEYISYIVGSGQHTNSHIWNSNGYLYQAPVTFYTQKGIWDLAPGFEGGLNSRWSRIISTECMNCHNMYSGQNGLSENRFINVQKGIECERCHGPGSKHVEEKLKGIVVDTAKQIDYTIVNPKKLPIELQTELCQRCHMQGITVLNEGKTYYDFRPGMYLNEVMNVFMPRYQNNDARFIMASHADRMKQSRCYTSGKMTCITCHNPHISVKQTPESTFNSACIHCHQGSGTCKEKKEIRMQKNDNCYTCHMPVSETLDIPHVTIHDHKIRVVNSEPSIESNEFTHLECMTQQKVSHQVMAEGYLMMYEAFVQKKLLLDSASYHLNLCTDKKSQRYLASLIQYYFWNQQYDSILKLARLPKPELCNAWTAYRIGEAYFQKAKFEEALRYFDRAASLKKEELDFLNKKGKALVMLQRIHEAKYVFEQIIYLQPRYESAYSNLSYVHLLMNNANYALQLADKALSLNPLYEEAMMNKVASLVALKRKEEAVKLLNNILMQNPANAKARLALQQLLQS